MFDLHYDLLTYIYINRNRLKEVKKHCNKIFKDNITGGIFNLFYMSPKEMKEELGIKKNELNIIKNLETVNKIIKEEHLIPNNIDFIYGIEGLNYLENLNDIDKIYNLGVKSVNIVWNNDNKFGGGAKGNKDKGLTNFGKELVEKLIEKRIAIDLSHTNDKTFYDIISLCIELKIKGKEPIVFASHSNIRVICNNSRNLTDSQIIKIKELDGVVGIVGVKKFCIEEDQFDNNKRKYQNAYIEHINYIKKLLGDIENISISTDDMSYYKINYYKNFNIFKQQNIKKELSYLLNINGFSENEIEKIEYKNFKTKILQRL